MERKLYTLVLALHSEKIKFQHCVQENFIVSECRNYYNINSVLDNLLDYVPYGYKYNRLYVPELKFFEALCNEGELKSIKDKIDIIEKCGCEVVIVSEEGYQRIAEKCQNELPPIILDNALVISFIDRQNVPARAKYLEQPDFTVVRLLHPTDLPSYFRTLDVNSCKRDQIWIPDTSILANWYGEIVSKAIFEVCYRMELESGFKLHFIDLNDYKRIFKQCEQEES